MGNSLILFGSSFVAVLLFGFQSQIVRDKHALAAFFTSMFIGISQLAFFKFVPDASFIECVFWIFGGMCGIVSSIYAHNIWLRYFPSKKHHKVEQKPKRVADIPYEGDRFIRDEGYRSKHTEPTYQRGHPAYLSSLDD